MPCIPGTTTTFPRCKTSITPPRSVPYVTTKYLPAKARSSTRTEVTVPGPTVTTELGWGMDSRAGAVVAAAAWKKEMTKKKQTQLRFISPLHISERSEYRTVRACRELSKLAAKGSGGEYLVGAGSGLAAMFEPEESDNRMTRQPDSDELKHGIGQTLPFGDPSRNAVGPPGTTFALVGERSRQNGQENGQKYHLSMV